MTELPSTPAASTGHEAKRALEADVVAIKAALLELVRLKEVKNRFGENMDYRANKDRAWAEARRVLGLK